MEVYDSRSLVSADCGSDHQMVWMTMKGKAWTKQKNIKRKRKRDLHVLQNIEKQKEFEEKLKNKMNGEKTWNALQQRLLETIEEMCPVKPPTTKPWIDDECWKLMQERSIQRRRNPNGEEHRNAAKKVKKALRGAKRKWYKEVLKETEEAQRRGDYKTVYANIKKVSKKKINKPGIGIKDSNGNMIYEKEEIKKRWQSYCSELFGRGDVVREEMNKDEEEPEVLETEISQAIKKLKREKAVGVDEVPAEALKAGGVTVIKTLKSIIDEIWKTGKWPEQWVVSELVLLPKVPGTQDCTKYRTISLISHASKVLLEIIRQRLQYYLTAEIAEEQFGFTTGKGTTEAILVVRNMIQKVAKKQDDDKIWFLFIDYSKAFDSVYHDAIWNTLKEFGVPNHLIWLLKGLYDHAKGIVRVDNEHTEEFPFEKGVRQGCLVSPLLFKIIGERIMRKVEERLEERPGKVIGGRCMWNVRYADDTTMVSRSKEECGKMGEELSRVSKEVGLTINKSKTSTMTIHGEGSVEIEGESIEREEKIKFLGSYITPDGGSQTDIKIRTALAKAVTTSMAEVWKSTELSTGMKVRLAKALIWSVALYACETWTIRKQEEKMIEALEMWIWRRIMRVRWTERKTNEWVRKQAGVSEEGSMLAEVRKRKIRKYGHWKRRGASMVLASIEGETGGSRRRGRQRMEWIDNIISWEGGLEQAHRNAWKRRSTVPRGL